MPQGPGLEIEPDPGVIRVPENLSRKDRLRIGQGYGVGAWCEVVFASDLVVASEDARFGFPEVNMGVTITNGGTFFAPERSVSRRTGRWLILHE